MILAIDQGFPRHARELLELARKVADHSYNPYSQGYLVGAAVQTGDGQHFTGCFMENASYGLTICAEPAAVLAANSAGRRDIHTLAVVGGDSTAPTAEGACTPCGRCRQILWEIAVVNDRDVEIYCADLDLSTVLLTTTSELLPHAWGTTVAQRHATGMRSEE